MKTLKKTTKTLTNNEVLIYSRPGANTGGVIYFAAALREIKNYDIQKCVAKCEELLKAEGKEIVAGLKATYGDSPSFTNPEVVAILDAESAIVLPTTKITDDQMRSFNPNYDMLKCLELIRE